MPYALSGGREGGAPLLKSHLEKKFAEKSLIPLPPTRFTSQKSAKPVGSATKCPAQARCGLWQLIGHCTECKVLQRNANPLRVKLPAPGSTLRHHTQWQ